jgi:uncharacterized membrane protein YhaH (DUF805 family)
MSLMFEPLKKYATFRGRARRTEYWLWQLFLTLVFGVLTAWLFGTTGPIPPEATPEEIAAIVEASSGALLPATLIGIGSLALFLPSLGVSVRRLHDTDRSGWWLLLSVIPLGGLVLLVFTLLDGTAGPNKHGADPKGRSLA